MKKYTYGLLLFADNLCSIMFWKFLLHQVIQNPDTCSLFCPSDCHEAVFGWTLWFVYLVFAFPSTRIPPRIIHPNAAFEESDFSSGLDTGWYSANGYFSRIYVTCIWQYLRAIQTSDWTFSKKYNLVAAEKMHQSSSCVNVENIQENYGSFLSGVYHLGLELYNSASISVHRIQIFDLRSDDVFVLIIRCLSELTRTSTNPAPLKLKTRQMFSDSNNFCWRWEPNPRAWGCKLHGPTRPIP